MKREKKPKVKKTKIKKVISPEQKNNMQIKTIYILLGIFLILVSVFTYFLFTDEKLFKIEFPKKEKPKKEPPIQNTHINMEVSYFENLLDGTLDINFLEDGFNNIEELSNQEKLTILFYSNNEYIKELEIIDTQFVDTYFKNNFNTTVNHENIKCAINEDNYCYIFDEENNTYIENFIDENQKKEILSNYINRNLYGKVTDYKQENNTYTFTRYELYRRPCYDNCNLNTKFYSDVKSANKEELQIITLSKNYTKEEIIDYNMNKLYELVLETNFDIYKNLMTTHTYTFKKVDNNYILTSYQINTLD